jgi:hypothetical protein
MKRLFILAATGLLLLSTAGHGAEMARSRLFCYSLRFAEGTTFGGTLDLSTIGGPPYNGELLPYSGREWASYFFLYYGGYGTIPGTIYVNLPASADANGNGFDDFFEVSQGVSATTSGSEYTDISSGTVTATWSRPAGSKNGTCVLHLNDDTYGDLGYYTCAFELIEYAGPLTYTPGSNTVSAAVNLTQTGNPANTLQGPVVFDKSATDRFNTLTNRPGVWTNAALQPVGFDGEIFSRVAAWPTNYAGFVYCADGDPNTAAPDYQLWVLSIDDTNDANANGIPDFSDDLAIVLPPRAPQLSLIPGATNLWLTVRGDVGSTNLIQEINSLASTNWQTTKIVVATNDPQIISLPLPGGTNTFWRVLALW